MDFRGKRLLACVIDHFIFGSIASIIAFPGFVFDHLSHPFELRFPIGSTILNAIAVNAYIAKDVISKYGLKVAREAIKINTSLYDNFIDSRVANQSYTNFSWRLFHATRPEFPPGGNMLVSDFREKIQREHEVGLIAESSFLGLMEILNRSAYGNQEILFIENIGYLILVFPDLKEGVSFYFLPETKREFVAKSGHYLKYRDCN